MYQLELPENGRLTEKQAATCANQIAQRAVRFGKLKSYFEGRNVAILGRSKPEDSKAPHNQVPVPWGRQIINTVTGYMYKPGLIQHKATTPEGIFAQRLQSAFKLTKERRKNSRLGKLSSIYGVAYELHYAKQSGSDVIPTFAIPDPSAILPIFDHQIEPQLIAAVRKFSVGNKEQLEVYYSDALQMWYKNEQGEWKSGETTDHFYGAVPLAIYRNNEEEQGDFEPVLPLIDAYDVLISDSLNELDRFAHAYLVVKGLILDKAAADDVKLKRLFQTLEKDASISFLTKDIQDQFLENLKETLSELIHTKSQVPDLSDDQFAGNSTGVALQYKLTGFENLAATKELHFREGLEQRISLMGNFLQKKAIEPEDVEWNFSRNLPRDIAARVEVLNKISEKISDETFLELLKSMDLIDDVKKEIARIAAELKQKRAQMDPYPFPGTDEDEDPEDDEPEAA